MPSSSAASNAASGGVHVWSWIAFMPLLRWIVKSRIHSRFPMFG